MEHQRQLQSLSDEYQTLQNDMTTLVSARQKLESQLTENKGVQVEFDGLSDDANVYKLVGPVLLKQETSEAKNTVDSRLEFIHKEIKRIEDNIKDIQSRSSDKRDQILHIQSQAQ